MREDILRFAIIAGFVMQIVGFVWALRAVVDAFAGETKVKPKEEDALGIGPINLGAALRDLRRLPGVVFPAFLFCLGGSVCAVTLALALG